MAHRHNILILEDELMIGLHVRLELEKLGYKVIGPTSTVKGATIALDEEDISAAVLDLQLYGELSLPIAQLLSKRGIPFMFVTGSRVGLMPDRFPGITILPKPIDFALFEQKIAMLCAQTEARKAS